MALLIKGGRVVDPLLDLDDPLDILIEEGRISHIAPLIEKEGAHLLEAQGKAVVPGLIDMHCHLRDYLLGLSTFAPDLFARRDAWWEAGNPRFYQLNDALQYLGCFAFRDPVPAYRHSAAQFLRLRGWIESDATHPDSPRRPESDREVLAEIARSLGVLAG